MNNFIYLTYKIEPIFYKIIYMSMIATIIGISILIIRKLLRKEISSKWISRIWLVFIISLILPIQFKSSISIYNIIPVKLEKIEDITVSRKNLDIEEKDNRTIEVSSESGTQQDSMKKANDFNATKIVNILFFLPLIWLILLLMIFIAYLITYISFELKIKNNILENTELENILNKSKEKLKITNNIKVVKQDIIKMPSIFGVFNIRILINDNILNLSSKELEYIFLHELSHYKRKDNILNILITILRCIYIFNPIIWILLNEVKRDLELATDELAMENENSEIKKEYCKTLVKVSTINSNNFLIQTMCLSDDKKNLERRIDSVKLINILKNKRNSIRIISLLIILALIIFFWTRCDNYMSQKDIIKLSQKSDKYTNAHCIEERSCSYVYKENPENIQTTYTITDYFYMDNIVCEKSTINYENNSNTFYRMSYINYDENEAILINSFEDKTIDIIDLSNVTKENRSRPIFKSYRQATSDDWINSDVTDMTYNYLGKENINNRETYKIETKVVTDYGEEDSIIWYDKEKGLRLKEDRKINFTENSGATEIKEQHEILNYTYEFDVVTDKDLQRPNLEEYSDYTIFRQSYLVTHY